MKKRLLFLLTLAVLVPVACLPAHAEAFDLFTLTSTSGLDVITFNLPSTPTGTTINMGQAFVINGPVSVTFDGTTVQAGVEFFDDAHQGGLSIFDLTTGNPFVITTSTTQLFNGSLASPGSFIWGVTLQTHDFHFPTPTYDEDFSLGISAGSAPPPAVPEPSTITMLGMGLAGLVAPARRVLFRNKSK